MRRILILLPLLAVAACQDEPTVAEKFNALKGELENSAARIESEAENVVAAEERARLNETEALIRETANQLGPSNAVVDVETNRLN